MILALAFVMLPDSSYPRTLPLVTTGSDQLLPVDQYREYMALTEHMGSIGNVEHIAVCSLVRVRKTLHSPQRSVLVQDSV